MYNKELSLLEKDSDCSYSGFKSFLSIDFTSIANNLQISDPLNLNKVASVRYEYKHTYISSESCLKVNKILTNSAFLSIS